MHHPFLEHGSTFQHIQHFGGIKFTVHSHSASPFLSFFLFFFPAAFQTQSKHLVVACVCVCVYIMRREQPTFSFTFYCSEVAALHMARPLMTERLRRPRPKHLAVLYTSPPHRQPITTSLWVVEGGAPVEHCPVHCAHAHTHAHTYVQCLSNTHTHSGTSK